MRNLLFLLLMSFLATSCMDLVGSFSAKQMMQFNQKKSRHSSPLIVAAGRYDAKFSFDSKKKIKMTIKDVNGSDKESVIFQIPKNVKIPTERGDLFLTTDQVKQPYDIYVQMNTEYTSSETIDSRESCTWTVRRRVCHQECSYGPYGRSYCRPVCHDEIVTYYGERRVRYYYRYTDKVFDAEFFLPGETVSVGTFHGLNHDATRIYEYQGQCH